MLIALYYSAFVIALALIPLSIVNAVEAPYKNWKKNSIAFVSYATVLIASICSVYFCNYQLKELDIEPQYEATCIIAFILALGLRYATYTYRVHREEKESHHD